MVAWKSTEAKCDFIISKMAAGEQRNRHLTLHYPGTSVPPSAVHAMVTDSNHTRIERET